MSDIETGYNLTTIDSIQGIMHCSQITIEF